MRLPWYAGLCFAFAAGCAADAAGEDDGAPLAHERGLDAGLGGTCDSDPAGRDAGASDAATPDAQVTPQCDVVFATRTLDGDERAVLTPDGGELTIRQWAENRSAQPQTLRYRRPCRGTLVTGIPGYDPHRSCLAGACTTALPPTEVVLAPGARAQLGVGYLDARPGICNRSGLAAGAYEVGFALIDLAGAAVCEEPLHLTVR